MKNSVEINLGGFARIRNILGQDLFHLGAPFQRKSCYFHMSNLPFKGAVSLLEKPILLHNMQYFWHRASLSKVQYVLKSEILSECFFAPSTEHWSFMATQSSFEKAAFVETWITFHWYMYLIYSNLIQFNPIQSNPDISHLYNPIQSNQTQTNPIQSNPIISNPIQSI